MKTNVNYMLIDARRWDEAFDNDQLFPGSSAYSSLGANLWIGMMRARRAEEAAQQLLAWATETGRDVDLAAELGELLTRSLAEGETVDIPPELIDQLQVGTEVSELYAAAGDSVNTLDSLENAHRTGVGFRSLLSMKINPSYDFIRDDSQFVGLLEEIGLQD